MKISEVGLTLIKHYEGLHDGDLTAIGLQPKMCPAGIWTVGYGRALRDENGWLRGENDAEKAYQMYPALTESEAVTMLDEDCDIYENRLKSLNLNLLQHEFDALVSFTYNVGFANFKSSTILKYILSNNKGHEAMLWAFGLWNKARVKGVLKPLPGLTRRRKTEALLFLTGKLYFNG